MENNNNTATPNINNININNNNSNKQDDFKPITPIQVKILTIVVSILLLGQSVIRIIKIKSLNFTEGVLTFYYM
jgi:hypothetical protein